MVKSSKHKIWLIAPLLLLSILVNLSPIQFAHGLLWSSPISIDQHSGPDILPYALQATNGTIWVAWQSDRFDMVNGRYDILYKTLNPSGSWSAVHNLTSRGMNASPALVQLSNGTILAFWSSNPSANTCSPECNIYYERYDGRAWSSATQLSSGLFNDSLSAAAITRDGTLWLVWSREIVNCSVTPCSDTRQLYYRTLNNNVWSPEVQLTIDSNWNWGPSVVVGKDGLVRVVFSKGAVGVGDGEIYYKAYNGISWSAETQIVTSTGVSDEHPSMVQDRNGTLWIFWERTVFYQSTSFHLVIFSKSSFDNGQTWSTENQMTNTPNSVDSQMPSAIQSASSVSKVIWIFYSSNPSSDYDIWAVMSTAVSPIHDAKISGLSASNNLGTNWEYPGGLKSVGQSAIETITVTAANIGDYVENLFITLKATNTTTITIGTHNSLVGPGNAMNFYFYWNTTNVVPARYGLSVSIAALPGETLGNMGDNSYSLTNQVHIIPLGDVDQDGSVTITDVSVVFYDYDFTPACNCSRWNPYADVNGNGIIDIVDVGVVSRNFDIFT